MAKLPGGETLKHPVKSYRYEDGVKTLMGETRWLYKNAPTKDDLMYIVYRPDMLLHDDMGIQTVLNYNPKVIIIATTNTVPDEFRKDDIDVRVIQTGDLKSWIEVIQDEYQEERDKVDEYLKVCTSDTPTYLEQLGFVLEVDRRCKNLNSEGQSPSRYEIAKEIWARDNWADKRDAKGEPFYIGRLLEMALISGNNASISSPSDSPELFGTKCPNYSEEANKPIRKPVEPITWKEFSESGLLFYINQILHVFGIAIVTDVDDAGNITDVYPARVTFRGFGDESIVRGYKRLGQFVKNNVDRIFKDSQS